MEKNPAVFQWDFLMRMPLEPNLLIYDMLMFLIKYLLLLDSDRC